MGCQRQQSNHATRRERRYRRHLARIPDLHQRQHQRAGTEHHQCRAEIIDPMPTRRLAFVQE